MFGTLDILLPCPFEVGAVLQFSVYPQLQNASRPPSCHGLIAIQKPLKRLEREAGAWGAVCSLTLRSPPGQQGCCAPSCTLVHCDEMQATHGFMLSCSCMEMLLLYRAVRWWCAMAGRASALTLPKTPTAMLPSMPVGHVVMANSCPAFSCCLWMSTGPSTLQGSELN